ncbi:pirin family protein [Streptomyces sp. NPDC001985]|uniref:pirin family protein n=1 Tax=Streptomyces sp. NPDC001985 TaxID=3154406 RepID=UPI00332C2E7E
MIDVRRSADRYRGGEPDSGIDTRHSFSFGPHYDPDNLRFGALVAVNEERLAPGAGFAEHPHSNTEIVTWVTEGELTHRDSAGHATVVRPGDLQRLSAASGVRHEERNDGPGPLVFVQMWLTPLEPGGDPSYEVVRGLDPARPYPLPGAGARLHVRGPRPGERVALPAAPAVHLHVVRGAVRLDGVELAPGDTARITGGRAPEPVGAGAGPAEVLIWELPGV